MISWKVIWSGVWWCIIFDIGVLEGDRGIYGRGFGRRGWGEVNRGSRFFALELYWMTMLSLDTAFCHGKYPSPDELPFSQKPPNNTLPD